MPKKPARKPIPAPLQRCVTSVAPKMKAQGRGVGAAFAICTSQLQKSGVLKPGTRTVTHKGAGVISGIARRGEYRSTMREFERAITRKNGSQLTRRNPKASENGRYAYVMSCIDSTYEDMQALQASEKDVSRATFAKAIGKSQWADIQASLGYDRHFPIARDWHVGYYKGVFRGVPCYFLRHSRIEHIYTLNGDLGPSLEEE